MSSTTPLSLKTILITGIVCFIIAVLFQILSHKSYLLLGQTEEIDDTLQAELKKLGMLALESRDAPIASLILYKGKIIGSGYNTVLKDTNAGGHAEINAISDAQMKLSRKELATLDRDSLVLITTYEPCLMCQGAILEYNIKKVRFLKPKPLLHWLREDFRTYRYQWMRSKISLESLQDSLFYMHPDYPRNQK